MISNFGIGGKEEALFIKRLIEQLFAGMADSEYSVLNICGIQPYTRRQNEIDLLMLLHIEKKVVQYDYSRKNQRKVKDDTGAYLQSDIPANQKIYVETLVASIEIKAHSQENIAVEGDDLFVRYGKSWSPVTSKLISQSTSAKQFLAEQISTQVYNVIPLVYLPNVNKQELLPKLDGKNILHGLLFADSLLDDLIDHALYHESAFSPKDKNYSVLGQGYFQMDICREKLKKYYENLVPGYLEQEKLELIGKRFVEKDKQWVGHLQKKLIAFTGLAGTGKTLKLIRTSNDLLNDYMDPVLFLTFNRALARDLERLMQLQQLNVGGRITVWTIDTFLFKLAHRFKMYDDFDTFVADNEANSYEAIRELVREELQRPEVLRDVRENLLREFTYVAVDEGQDWFQTERDIVLDIFEPNHVILAAGTDQCLRAPMIANWKGDALRRECETEIIKSNVSLRLTSNLSYFNNALASTLELDWEVQPNKELLGGDIYLFESVNTQVLQVFLSEKIEGKPKYAPIDYMIMAAAKSKNLPFKQLSELQFEYWDGISEADRNKIPGLNQVRCVSLESCRGLEGWATLILDLEQWFWFCINRNRVVLSEKEDIDLFESGYLGRNADSEDFRYLPSWFLIPFTRAKNRMLIQLPSSGKLRSALLELAEKFSDFVHIL